MSSQILLPTDGSDEAEQAIEEGIQQAVHKEATIHALYVIDERFYATDYDRVAESEQSRGEAALETVQRHSDSAGVETEPHLRRGAPHEEILHAIDDYDIDLVVMGTHGRTGIGRVANVGSVTERTVRAAPVPVLVIPLDSSREPLSDRR